MLTRDISDQLGEPFEVYLVDTHDVCNPETGEVLFSVDEEVLKKTAEKGNKRIQDTGDYCPIITGHTKDRSKETEQPKLVGYAGPFRVDNFFDTGKKAIVATFRYFKDIAEKTKKLYPRRSIEVIWSDFLIDPIAVLGPTTPARDLGLTYSRQGDKIRYEMNSMFPLPHSLSSGGSYHNLSGEEGMNNTAVQEVLAILQNTAAWKKLEEIAKEKKDTEIQDAGKIKNAMGSVAGPINVGLPSEIKKVKKMSDKFQHYKKIRNSMDDAMEYSLRGEEEKAADCYKKAYEYMGGEFASNHEGRHTRPENEVHIDGNGGSAAVEHEEQKLSKEKMEEEPHKIKMALEKEKLEVMQYAKAFTTLAEEMKDLKQKYARAEREKDLIKLESEEGIIFDMQEELDTVVSLDKAQYEKHLDKMKTRYQRAPFGPTIEADTSNRLQSKRSVKTSNEDLSKKAIELAGRKGLSFSEAYDQVTASVNGRTI